MVNFVGSMQLEVRSQRSLAVYDVTAGQPLARRTYNIASVLLIAYVREANE